MGFFNVSVWNQKGTASMSMALKLTDEGTLLGAECWFMVYVLGMFN